MPKAGDVGASPVGAGGGDDRWTWQVLAAALAAILAVRLLALQWNATDLFFDEAQYWSWSEDLAFGYYSKPPLIAWIIRAATAVCGQGEACIRLPSALIHTATAAVIFLAARRLYDARVGLWAALAYATLPGVSVSAGIISTDVPLLLFWAMALLGLAALLDSRAWWPAWAIGLSLGLGLNAKYAMAYFVLATSLYIAVTPAHWKLVRDPRLWFALAIGLLLIVPNVLWNAQHSFATLSHTADNANWGGKLFNPGKMLEFLGAQFGVFGPVLFATLIVVAVRAVRHGLPEPDRMLMILAAPVLVVVTLQAFISRAHANWAAVSYVPAVILVTAVLVRSADRRWLVGSLALHVALMLGFSVATATAGRWALPGGADPFTRTLGWRALAEATAAELAAAKRAGRPFAAVLTDDRAVTAELLYYLRFETTPMLAWQDGPRPTDHYELTRPFRRGTPGPVLLVTLRTDVPAVTGKFTTAERVSSVDTPAGRKTRRVLFYRLDGYRGP